MDKVTLTEIRKTVEASGGEYRKLKILLNSQPAYKINGVLMTQQEMVLRYRMRDLPRKA